MPELATSQALMYIKAHIIDLETPSGILNLAKLSHSCHGNLVQLAEKLVWETKIKFSDIGPGGPFFPENFALPPSPCENNSPTCTTSEFRLLLSCALDRDRLLHYGG